MHTTKKSELQSSSRGTAYLGVLDPLQRLLWLNYNLLNETGLFCKDIAKKKMMKNTYKGIGIVQNNIP